jgi:hypothetical protein
MRHKIVKRILLPPPLFILSIESIFHAVVTSLPISEPFIWRFYSFSDEREEQQQQLKAKGTASRRVASGRSREKWEWRKIKLLRLATTSSLSRLSATESIFGFDIMN